MKLTSVAFALALLAAAQTPALAQEDPYEQGPVMVVTSVRTLPGQFENYMRYIFGDYARLLDAEKEAGIILDWGVMTTQTRTPDEANVILTTTYPNMAAFDGLDDRTDPIVQRVRNQTPAQAEAAGAQRGAMRTNVGQQMYRMLMPRQ